MHFYIDLNMNSFLYHHSNGSHSGRYRWYPQTLCGDNIQYIKCTCLRVIKLYQSDLIGSLN